MKVRRFTAVPLLLFSLATLSATAQTAPVCPSGFPAESPVVSSSADDIPATNVDIVTYTTTLAKARANHNIAFVELNPNEQQVWFFVDANPSLGRTFYNRRVRDTATGQWTWRYRYSPEVIRYPDKTSGGAYAVLYSPTAKYRDPAGTAYKYVMYQVLQPGACDGGVAGFVYYSLSNNGVCWTAPRQAKRAGGQTFTCGTTTLAESVPVEAMSAIDAGETIYLVGVEGDIRRQLAPPVTVLDATGKPLRYSNMNQTLTALGSATTAAPGQITIRGVLTANGMVVPRFGPANQSNPDRYKTHAYFINMDIAWDPATGNFYIGRAYPYPFDRGSLAPLGITDEPQINNSPLRSQVVEVNRTSPTGLPSPVEGCHDSPATLPNRVQIYRMNIGSLANIDQLLTGTWTLVTDIGGSTGYGFDVGVGSEPPPGPAPLQAGMQSVGLDLGAVSFLKNRRGELVRYGQTSYYFAADTYKQKKSVGDCLITGTERERLRVLP